MTEEERDTARRHQPRPALLSHELYCGRSRMCGGMLPCHVVGCTCTCTVYVHVHGPVPITQYLKTL